ncbi:hypothetical protein HYQ45_005858 [Verticillium longisporum]|uniref:Uncharacterized protein n=1 Tax=Verticillium longisporum TaxID=100787 RepID=A0A8I2ZQA3_VERLO|nr:hypothetical protein HYQ45_005858 [Verticillium longisporum]
MKTQFRERTEFETQFELLFAGDAFDARQNHAYTPWLTCIAEIHPTNWGDQPLLGPADIAEKASNLIKHFTRVVTDAALTFTSLVIATYHPIDFGYAVVVLDKGRPKADMTKNCLPPLTRADPAFTPTITPANQPLPEHPR